MFYNSFQVDFNKTFFWYFLISHKGLSFTSFLKLSALSSSLWNYLPPEVFSRFKELIFLSLALFNLYFQFLNSFLTFCFK